MQPTRNSACAVLPKEEWQGALCLSAAPAPAPATHPWADGRCRRREEAGVGPTCQLPPARRRAPAHVATCSPQLLALDSLLPHPVFVFCYRVVPGHRNWQIETAAWIWPSFFHCALETRWLGVRKTCEIGLFYRNYRPLLQETGWLVSDFISVCLETRWLGQKKWFLCLGTQPYRICFKHKRSVRFKVLLSRTTAVL